MPPEQRIAAARLQPTFLMADVDGDPAEIKLMGYSQIVRGKVAGVARAINVELDVPR
jgi:multidrug resistance efflux pump